MISSQSTKAVSRLQIEVVTLFPEMIREALRHGIVGRAQERGLLQCRYGESAGAHR